MATPSPISGYEFMRRFLDKYRPDAIDRLIAKSPSGGETQYFELKAGMTLQKDDEAKGDKLADLYWNYAKSLISMANGSGGLFVIGINDKTHRHVPLESCDPRHVIQNEHLDAYLQKEVLDRIFPDNGKWTGLKDGSIYTCKVNHQDFLEPRFAKYTGKDVIALLVKPRAHGELVRVCLEQRGKRSEKLPVRAIGDYGRVDLLETSDEFARFESKRKVKSDTLGIWWAKIDPESAAAASSGPFVAQATGVGDIGNDELSARLIGTEMRTDFRPGDVIDKYKVIRKLGTGGMSVVYEVEHPNLKVHRALKLFNVNTNQRDILQSRFRTEGQTLARLNHPHIIRVHDLNASQSAGCLYYEMDLVLPSEAPDATPQTLADFVGKVKDRDAAELFADLCDALAYLHKKGIYHRDVKLENVLVDTNGRAVLSDFGIARIHDPELKKAVNYDVTFVKSETASSEGPEVGSLHYLAPELQDAKAAANAQSDTYALGVLFFRLLTGKWYVPGLQFETALKGHGKYWKKLLPRLLAVNAKDRPKDLSVFAPQRRIKYPSFWRKLTIFLAWLGALTLFWWIYLFSQVFEEENATKSEYDSATLPEPTTSVSAAPQPQAEPAIQRIPAPKRASKFEASPDNYVRDFPKDTEAFDQAESDFKNLSSRFLSSRSSYLDDNDASLHEEIYAIWKEARKFTELGMKMDELVVSRKDLIVRCAKVRQEATVRVDRLIKSRDYEAALKLYSALSDEFRSVGFAPIPRPSFTPQ